MRVWVRWPIWGKAVYIALTAYSALLSTVSISVFYQAIRQHWGLKLIDILLQSLMLLFLPMLLIGLWKIRLAASLLFLGAATNLGLLLSANRSTGDGITAMLAGSLLFLGTPMVASAILLRLLSPSTPSQNKTFRD
jgi:hypothetical protein